MLKDPPHEIMATASSAEMIEIWHCATGRRLDKFPIGERVMDMYTDGEHLYCVTANGLIALALPASWHRPEGPTSGLVASGRA